MQQSTGAICPAPTRSQYASWSIHRLAPHLPVILFIISIALFFGALVASSVPQRFEASTTLMLADERRLAPLDDMPNAAAAIMATPDFVRDVISQLGITSDELMMPRLLPDVIAKWMVSLGLMSSAPGQQPEDELIRAYLGALETSFTLDGRALIITITANQPEIAARAANISAQIYLERRNKAEAERNSAYRKAEQRVLQAQALLQEALERERAFRTNPAGLETARQARKAADDLAILIAERAALILERDAVSRQSGKVEHLAKRISEIEAAIRLRQAVIAAAADNSERQQALEQAVESARVELALVREILADEMTRLQISATSGYVIIPAKPPKRPDRFWPTIIGGVTAMAIAACLFGFMRRAKRGHDGSDMRGEPVKEPVQVAVTDSRSIDEDSRAQTSKMRMATSSTLAVEQAEDRTPVSLNIEKPLPYSVVRWNQEGAEAFRLLLNGLAIAPHKDGGKHLLVIGADAQTDPLLFARELARYLAMHERVIMLDLSPTKTNENGQTPGLSDLIAGRASFAEIITRDSGSRLHQVLRGTGQINNGSMSDAIELAMAALDQTYDWIVQAVPMEDQDTFLQYALKKTDGAVLVAHGEAEDVNTLTAYESLREKGLKNIVVALIE